MGFELPQCISIYIMSLGTRKTPLTDAILLHIVTKTLIQLIYIIYI